MKTLKQLLSEKRRNPKQNPKTSAYEKLKKYKGRNDIFITFTSINKVGINPHNDYNTPTAIYAYPLAQVWKPIELSKDASKVPYQGKQKFIQVIKPKGNFIHDLATKYTKSMYDKDIKTLRKLYDGKAKNKKGSGRDIYIRSMETFAGKITSGWFEDNLKKLKIYSTNKKTQKNIIKLKTGIKLIMDKIKKDPDGFQISGFSSIKNLMNEMVVVLYDIKDETIFWNDIDTLDNKDKFRVVMNTVIQGLGNAVVSYNNAIDESEGKGIEWSIDVGASDSRHKSWGGKMWNITRLVANGHSQVGTKSAVVRWNKILRTLGYSGMADRSGKGIIHPAEPTQAIFLSTSGLKHIETIRNTNPRKY